MPEDRKKSIPELIEEIAIDERTKWINKAKRRRRWRWFMGNKFILKIRLMWAKIKIKFKRIIK